VREKIERVTGTVLAERKTVWKIREDTRLPTGRKIWIRGEEKPLRLQAGLNCRLGVNSEVESNFQQFVEAESELQELIPGGESLIHRALKNWNDEETKVRFRQQGTSHYSKKEDVRSEKATRRALGRQGN